jgi:hypothetical protein
MAMTKREAIYDEQISPLMTRIIAICKEHSIPMIFQAQINDDRKGLSDVNEDGEELGPFFCTTVLAGGDLFPDTHEQLLKAAHVIKPKPASYAGYVVSGGVAERVTGSDDGYDPGVAGAVRGRVMP